MQAINQVFREDGKMTLTICYVIFMVLTGALLAYVTGDSIRVKKGKKSYIFKDKDKE